jgi:hypothetical protein
MAHWARRNRLLLVAWAVIVAAAIPIALLSRDEPVADREALVIAQRLDMSLTAPTLTSGAVALVVVLAVGMAVGFALGRLSPAHRDDRRPGAAQDPLF